MLLAVFDEGDHSDDVDYLELLWLITDTNGVRTESDYRAPAAPVWIMDEYQIIGDVTSKGRKFRIA